MVLDKKYLEYKARLFSSLYEAFPDFSYDEVPILDNRRMLNEPMNKVVYSATVLGKRYSLNGGVTIPILIRHIGEIQKRLKICTVSNVFRFNGIRSYEKRLKYRQFSMLGIIEVSTKKDYKKNGSIFLGSIAHFFQTLDVEISCRFNDDIMKGGYFYFGDCEIGSFDVLDLQFFRPVFNNYFCFSFTCGVERLFYATTEPTGN